jgi:ribokinase
MKSTVICLGAINLDLIFQAETLDPFAAIIPGLRAGGEYALGAEQESRLQSLLSQYATLIGRSGGGQAANTAFALARLGIPVILWGRVGADTDGDYLRQGLAGVDCHYLKQQGASGRAYILVDGAGERTILVSPNTNDLLTVADFPGKLLDQAHFLYLTSFVGEAPLQAQILLVNQINPGVKVILDPGELYARRGRACLAPLLSRTDTLLATLEEWRLLGGEPRRWPEWAPPQVVLKLGGRGARLLSPAGLLEVPGETVSEQELQDTLGAGDVFAAGWLTGLQYGLNPETSIRLANRLAAESVKGRGREHYPTKNFLDEKLKTYK